MPQKINFLQGWFLYFIIILFMAFLIHLVFVFPVSILLILLNVPEKALPFINRIGGFLAFALISFILYKWSVQTFIFPQLKQSTKQQVSPNEGA